MILFCPDLVGKEEVKAVYVGHGDFVRPVLNDVGVKSPYSTLKILHKHTIFLPL